MTYLQNKKRAFIAMIANLSTKIKRLVSGGTSVTLSDVADSQSLVLLQFQGNGSGDKTSNQITNLVDGSFYNSSGNIATMNGYSRTDKITVGDTRALKLHINPTESVGIYLLQWNGTSLLSRASQGATSITKDYNINLNASATEFAFFFTKNVDKYSELHLRNATDEYSYEPIGYKIDVLVQDGNSNTISLPMYLGSNQLNSLNGHTDKAIMDFENKTSKNVKNTITRVFNGTESWTTTGDVSAGVYQGFAVASATYNVAKPTSGKYQTICDAFPYSATNVVNTSRIEAGNFGLRLIVGADRVPSLTKADFITWLKANPITITYPCATEYEEVTTDLNTTTLNATETTHEGTTVIVDGSTNKVSGMDVEYYASK